MKNWLAEKEQEQKNLFKNLLEISMNTLKDFNEQEQKQICVRVVFSKDKWLEGVATLEFLQKNDDDDDEYTVKNIYTHCVYNSNKDIHNNSILGKLMQKGLFTNAWFSILDSSRSYDTDFILTENKYILENDDCEYRENRMKTTHSGFNIIPNKEKKNKIK